MRTPEETIDQILSDMNEKINKFMSLARDSALQTVIGPPKDREKNENDAKRYKYTADVWGDAAHIVEFWTTGPGVNL